VSTTRPRALRKALFVAGALASVVAVAACGGGGSGSGSSGGKTTVSILEKWPDPQYAPFWKKAVTDYEAAHPNVHIDLQAVGDQPIKDKLQVLASSNKLPDIYFSWAGDFTKKFVRGGLAADLTSQLKGTDWGNSFAPAALTAYTYDGKIYGVPIDLDGKFFVYNTKIFKDHGLKAPATLNDLLSACGTLKSAGITPIAFGNQFGWAAVHYLTTLNARYVPPATLAKDYVPGSASWTDPGYAQALSTFQTLDKGCMTPGANGVNHDDAVAQVLNGKAAMVYVQSIEFSKFTTQQGAPAGIAKNFDFFAFPATPGATGDQQSLTGAPDGFLVNSKSKNQAAALDFLKFLTTQQNGEQLTKIMGRLSSVKGSANAQNTFPQLRGALTVIEKAPSFNIWLDTVTDAKVANAYLTGGEALIDGSASPQQVVANVKQASDQAKNNS
jgi:raffinose/stachyose/melibiose transport system substrate-binding protein